VSEGMSEEEAERRLRKIEREAAILKEYLGVKQGEAKMLQLYLNDEEKVEEPAPSEEKPPCCKKCGRKMEWRWTFIHPTASNYDKGGWICRGCGGTGTTDGTQLLWRPPPVLPKEARRAKQ